MLNGLGSAALLDMGNKDFTALDVDVVVVRHVAQLAVDQLVQVVGLGDPGDFLEGGDIVAAALQHNLGVVDVHGDDVVAVVPVTAIAVVMGATRFV